MSYLKNLVRSIIVTVPLILSCNCDYSNEDLVYHNNPSFQPPLTETEKRSKRKDKETKENKLNQLEERITELKPGEKIDVGKFFYGINQEERKELIDSLETQIKELEQEKIIFKGIIKDYTDISEKISKKFGKDNVFVNSANKTADAARWYIKKIDKDGFIVTTDLIMRSDLNQNPFTYERFVGLKDALDSYGIIESGKLWGINFADISCTDNILLIWKERLIDKSPNSFEMSLINDGSYKGFFVIEKGDLIVPGKKFYGNLLSDKIDISKIPKINFHFRSRYNTALDELNKGNLGKEHTESAIKIFDRLIKEDIMPDLFTCACYSGEGRGYFIKGINLKNDKLYISKEDELTAIKYYKKSLEINPNQPLIYVNISQTYLLLGEKEKAIMCLNDGLSKIKDKNSKKFLLNIKEQLSGN